MTRQINARNSSFFDNFKEEMQSGDPLRVREGIIQASKALVDAANTLPAYANLDPKTKLSKEDLKDFDIKNFRDKNGKIDREAMEAYLTNKAEKNFLRED